MALFTTQELNENEQRKLKLINLLQSGEAILMSGAGCSASLYPDWNELLELLYEEAILSEKDFPPFDTVNGNYLTYADDLKKCIGKDRFNSLIFHCFKPKNDGEKQYEKFHEVLCQFLNKGILKGITTTNYDPIFEKALNSVTSRYEGAVRIDKSIAPEIIFEFLFSLNTEDVPKRILHIHGVYNEPDSIILTGSEYNDKYGFKLLKPASSLYKMVQEGVTEVEFSNLLNEFGITWTQHRKILWSLFATRRLIFLGFSLSDPYFNQMLDSVSHDLHTFGYDLHYLVLRFDAYTNKEELLLKAKTLKRKYGIETVFFEDDDRKEGLSNFVFELENRLNMNKKEMANEVQAPSYQTPDVSNPDLNQQLINISRRR